MNYLKLKVVKRTMTILLFILLLTGMYTFPFSAAGEKIKVAIYAENKVFFQCDFDNGNTSNWSVVDEGEMAGPSEWNITDGICIQNSNIFTNAPGWEGTYFYTGRESWTNCIFTCRMKSTDDDRIGLMFRYKDAKNYYRFRWQNQKYGGAHRNLEKIVNGKWTLLTSSNGSYIKGKWHDIKVTVIDKDITVYIDGFKTLYAQDDSHSQGKIALYCSGNADSYFDNIAVYQGSPPKFNSNTISLKIIKGPYLQNVTKTGITIMWETSKEAFSRVDYGETLKYGSNVISNKLTKIHKVTISGLKPETEYHYRVNSFISYTGGEREDVASMDNTFNTSVQRSTPFSFTVYGDSRGLSERHKKIIKGIISKNPDFVINTGDLITAVDVDAGTLSYREWKEMFFSTAKDLIKNTPMYLAIGNHELREGAAHWIYKFFAFPDYNGYYSFNYGNAHFTILNSNAVQNIKVPDYRPGTQQYNWLKKDLKSSTAKWKFVIFHHPLYASPSESIWKLACEKMKVLAPVFEQYNVDVVFNGHIHAYERSYPLRNNKIDEENGVVYITTGGGGASLSKCEEGNWWTAKFAYAHHYCIMKINKGNLEMQVYDINNKGIDTLSIKK